MRIAVLDDFQGVALSFGGWHRLPAGCTVTVFSDHLTDTDAIVERLGSFDVACIMRERTPITREILSRLPGLRLIVTTGMANASLDIDAARQLGIVVCGTQSSGPATGELAMALMLAVARNLLPEVASVRAGGWQVGMGRSLSQSTVGLLGLGRLGTRVAQLARPFGPRLIAWSPNMTDDRAAKAGVEQVSKEDLFARSDFLSVHIVLSESTRGLVGAADLARMKPTATLINTSRGPVVDEAALVEALRLGRPGMAALDVFDREPLPPESPFRSLPNVIPTPHIGYVTDEVYSTYFNETVEDILAFAAGSPVRVLGDPA